MPPFKSCSRKSLFFHERDRLAIELGMSYSRILWAGRVPIALLEHTGGRELLQVDQANTVLCRGLLTIPLMYSPYGHLPLIPPTPLLAFAGQRLDNVSGCYPLGNGKRMFSPSLMRFYQSDAVSPFAEGGTHSYAYCQGDPVNRQDSNGQMWHWIKRLVNNVIARAIHAVEARLRPNHVQLLEEGLGMGRRTLQVAQEMVDESSGAMILTPLGVGGVFGATTMGTLAVTGSPPVGMAAGLITGATAAIASAPHITESLLQGAGRVVENIRRSPTFNHPAIRNNRPFS